MVTFKPVGRLGNFLFEAASCMAYAYKHNLDFSIPSSTRDPYWHPIYLQHLVNPCFDPTLPEIHIKEKTFAYHERMFSSEWDAKHNIWLDGYWQSEKYFKDYADAIVIAFRYPWVSMPDTVVSVHVRRGDYLTVKKGEMFKHPPVSKRWYEEQMEKFPGKCFVFFSDDIKWCRNEFGKRRDVSFGRWSELPLWKPEEQDLIHMSSCAHNICSASTFSWWAAWLNRNPTKRVIMPKQWMNPDWSDLDQSDIVPERWERA